MMGKALVWLPPLAAAAAGRAAGSSRRLGLGAASRLPVSRLPVPGARPRRTQAATAHGGGSGSGSGDGVTPGRPHKRAAVASSSTASCPSTNASLASSLINRSPDSSASTASSSTLQPQPRQRRIPPLPYWCEAVAVVGLPHGQLVFCFLTSAQASAARRQLQPEAAYGSAALPLAVVPDERVQALLDKWQVSCQEAARCCLCLPELAFWCHLPQVHPSSHIHTPLCLIPTWQYAVAQQEMDTLEVRPPLWQSYRSAGKAAVASGASAAAATDALPPQPGLSRTQQLLAAKHEAKEQRRLQKLARKRVASAARKAKASGGAGSSSAQAVSQGARSAEHPAEQQDAGSSGQRAAQQQASGARQQQASSADLQAQPDALPLLGAAAASLDWEVCTVRGLPDGTTIFCFGDSNDAQQDGDATGGTNAERRKQRRRRLRAEAMLPYVEGQQFSSALRLGTLFPDVVREGWGCGRSCTLPCSACRLHDAASLPLLRGCPGW